MYVLIHIYTIIIKIIRPNASWPALSQELVPESDQLANWAMEGDSPDVPGHSLRVQQAPLKEPS